MVRKSSKKKMHFKPLKMKYFDLIRRIHTSILAKPKERVLKPWPDPKLEQTLPATIPEAALKAKPSERTIMLYRSKQFHGQKYEPPKKPDHYVEPSALQAVASVRLIQLAQPKKIHKVRKTISQKKMDRIKKKFEKYKKERPKWLVSRAAPKTVQLPKPEPEPRLSFPYRQWAPLSQQQRADKIRILARPPIRRMRKKYVYPTKKRKMPEPELRSVPDRVFQLALPKRILSETLRNMKYKPGEIKRSALRAILTDRTKALSVPRPRSKAVDNDVREDAFTISPTALTYKPSRRIIELAKPRQRS